MRKYSKKIIHFLLFQVTSQGQIIGAVVATDQIIAQAAAKMIEVKYENIEPIIISIEVFIKKIYIYILLIQNMIYFLLHKYYIINIFFTGRYRAQIILPWS